MTPIDPRDFLGNHIRQEDLDKMRPEYWLATWWRRIYVTLRWGAYTGFVCWFSKRFWDIHDYTRRGGGDGEPCHFRTCVCWNCGKEFTI